MTRTDERSVNAQELFGVVILSFFGCHSELSLVVILSEAKNLVFEHSDFTKSRSFVGCLLRMTSCFLILSSSGLSF